MLLLGLTFCLLIASTYATALKEARGFVIEDGIDLDPSFKCRAPIDIILIVDASCGANMQREYCQALKDHLKKLVSYFDVGADIYTHARIALVGYDRVAYSLIKLDRATSVSDIHAAIDAYRCDFNDAQQHDLADAVAHALGQFDLYKRVTPLGEVLDVERALFIYPICPCNECDVEDGICLANNLIDFAKMHTTQVSVCVCGGWTGPEDYECLISNSKLTDHESDHLALNSDFNKDLFDVIALKFAMKRCPPPLTRRPTSPPTPRPFSAPSGPLFFPTSLPTQRPIYPPTPRPTNAIPSGASPASSPRPTWSKGSHAHTRSPTTQDGRYRPHPIHFDGDDSNGHIGSSSDEWWEDSSSSSSGSSSSSSSSSDHNGLHWSIGSSSSSSSSSSSDHNGRHWGDSSSD